MKVDARIALCPHPGCGPGESIALCLKIQTTLLTARCVKWVQKLNPRATSKYICSSYMLFLLIDLMLSCSNTLCDSKRATGCDIIIIISCTYVITFY